MLTVKITPSDKGNPPGKLADVELHFTDLVCPVCRGNRHLRLADGVGTCITCRGEGILLGRNPLAGLKLIGFAVWERRGNLGRNVTFPARQYSVNGERRSFALLRPIIDARAQNRIPDLILDAYAEHEERQAEAV